MVPSAGTPMRSVGAERCHGVRRGDTCVPAYVNETGRVFGVSIHSRSLPTIEGVLRACTANLRAPLGAPCGVLLRTVNHC